MLQAGKSCNHGRLQQVPFHSKVHVHVITAWQIVTAGAEPPFKKCNFLIIWQACVFRLEDMLLQVFTCVLLSARELFARLLTTVALAAHRQTQT